MSPQDFVKSLAIMKGALPSSEEGFIEKLFKRVDTDGDGVLNYEEYCMFYTLLTNTEKDFRIAFEMFDKDGNGKINATEFEELMTAMVADPSTKVNFKGGLTEFLFGPNYDRQVSFSTLYNLVAEVRNDVWWHEFRQLDREGKGKIPLTHMREFLFGSDATNAPALPDEVASKLVGFATYKMFNELILQSNDIVRALGLLQAGGRECTKRAFARSLALCGLKMTRTDIDVIFQLFDLNGDGTMDVEEFNEVVKRRQSFNSVEVDRRQPNRSIAQDFFYCMQQRSDD
jgi:solute carrier family 25 aspartate/glutamate transporter 12/13